jgi:hypothetical protein
MALLFMVKTRFFASVKARQNIDIAENPCRLQRNKSKKETIPIKKNGELKFFIKK